MAMMNAMNAINATNWLGDDDPDLLRAALEIIESWDCESSVNGVTTASSPAATDDTDSTNDENDNEADGGSEDGSEGGPASPDRKRKPPAKARANSKVPAATTVTQRKTKAGNGELKPSTVASTRHKRREEIIYLRDKVKEMEDQLATLHAEKVANGDDNRDVFAGAGQGVEAALAVMWQDISSRQQRLRQKAELEQAKLRGLLETQMKVARGLLKLMQKARRMEEDETFPSKRPRLPVNVSLDVNETGQCAVITKMHAEMDKEFTFPKFNDGTLKFVDIEVKDDQEDEVILELRDAWAVPFASPQVLDAAWQYIAKKTEQKRCREDMSVELTVHGDQIVSHFAASANMSGLKGSFDGKGIYQRFAGTQSTPGAIISTMFVDQHDVSADPVHGIHINETSWIRVLPSKSGTSTDGRPLALVQSVQRFRLTFDETNFSASRRQAGVLTDFLLDQLTQEIQFKHETVETLLLSSRAAPN